MSTADDRWWDLIERARGDGDTLVDLLARELTFDELVLFDKFAHERMRDAFRWDLWAIAYIMNGGCSDDGFDYFCGWLVSRGKAHYNAALANPEAAADGVSPDDEPFEFEAMWNASARAWNKKAGKQSDDFYKVAVNVERRLQGEPFDEPPVPA